MSKKIRLPINSGKNYFKFPDKCIYCGLPKEGTLKLKEGKSEEIGRQKKGKFAHIAYKSYDVELDVPYCRKHIGELKQNQKTISTLFAIGFLIALSVLFIFFKVVTVKFSKGYFYALLILGVLLFLGAFSYLFTKAIIWLFYKDRDSLSDISIINTIFGIGLLGIDLYILLNTKEAIVVIINDAIAEEFERLNTII